MREVICRLGAMMMVTVLHTSPAAADTITATTAATSTAATTTSNSSISTATNHTTHSPNVTRPTETTLDPADLLEISKIEGGGDTIPANNTPPSHNPGEGQDHMAFTFKIFGHNCTAVLIHQDWLLTAQTCLEDAVDKRKVSDKGALVYPNAPLHVLRRKGAKSKPKWRAPLRLQSSGTPGAPTGNVDFWRKIEQVIVHPGWKGLNDSWRGGDLILIKLAARAESTPDGYFAPVCLPEVHDELKQEDKLYIAGYGKRRIPYCVTDMHGPDTYGICGRPKSCMTLDLHRDLCGIEFSYQNQTYRNCLKIPNPSTHDPICIKLAKEKKAAFKDRTFVFDKELKKLLTTCYPLDLKDTEKGWCGTTPMEEHENREPDYHANWGYCSSEENQEGCEGQIDTRIQNTQLSPVSLLTTDYCAEQLEINFQEQKMPVSRSELGSLPGYICVGVNNSLNISGPPAYRYDKATETFTKQKINSNALAILSKGNISDRAVDGAACLGDLGGPLLKYENVKGVDRPILFGILSFLLWGTCRGKQEPGYYVRIQDYLDSFIYKHVPREGVCTSRTKKPKATKRRKTSKKKKKSGKKNYD